MSYKFTYPTVGKKRYPTGKPFSFLTIPIGLGFTLFLAITIYSGGLSWLLPGDPAVTEAALTEMIDRLRQGEAFGEAVTVFCKEIIAGA